MFQTNRLWDHAQAKKFLKEKATNFSAKALDIGGFILYKLKNAKKEYAFYKQTQVERENRKRVVEYINMWDKRLKKTGKRSLKDTDGCEYLVYAGDMNFKAGSPAPQMMEPTSGYRGPDADPVNPPDYKWKEKLG